MKKLRYAVIGAGSMGKNHVRAVHELPDTELVGIVDPDSSTATALGELHRCEAFTSLAQMFRSCQPQAVSICVPTSLHCKVTEECIEYGVHVLLEKPIASSVEEGKHLVALASKAGVKLMVGHIERFNPAVKKVKEMVDGGAIGNVVSVMARRVGIFPPRIKDANIVVDLAIHDIDIVNLLLDERPSRVVSDTRRNHTEHREDSVELFLRYPSASAVIQANWITPVKIRKLNITGTDGYIEMDYVQQKILYYKSNYEKYREEPGHEGGYADFVLKYLEPDVSEVNVEKHEPLKEEIRYFVESIEADRSVDASHAIDALTIALQARG